MKKILLTTLALAMLFLLAACGGTTTPDSGNDSSSNVSDNTIHAYSPTSESPEPTAESSAESTAESSAEPERDSAHEITYSNVAVYTNSIGTTWIQTIFEVTNTGTVDLYFSSGSYDLENQDGSLVASRTMVSVYPNVVSPGEKAYYYEETILDNYSGDGSDLVLLPRISVKDAKIENIRFPVTDITISDNSYLGIKTMGRVENTSSEDESMVYIAIVFYDENNQPIGLDFTILMDVLAAGDKIGFETTALSLPPSVTVDSVASYEAFAYPLQFQF